MFTSRVLDVRSCLILVLYWLRLYPTLSEMELLFNVSKATVLREIRYFLPRLFEALQDEITLPVDWSQVEPGFGGAQAILDCTSHFRHRVHPGQALFYRGDKHAHFLNAFVLTSLCGKLLNVCIGLGHNNDQGMFNRTLRTDFEEQNVVLLADRGYSHPQIITPNTKPKNSTFDDEDWPKLHAAACSPGEIINSLLKNWAFASNPCKQLPEWQAIGLGVVYCLVNMMLSAYPVRLFPERVH